MGQQQPRQRQNSFQFLVRINQINLRDRVRISFKLTQRFHGGRDVLLNTHAHVVRRHAAGSGVRRKLQQLLDIMPLVRLHFLQNGLALLVRHLAEQVRRRARVHLFDDVRRAFRVQSLQQR